MALKHLVGRWYILESTLNFWKNPNIIDPEITFTIAPGKFINETHYLENGKSKSVKAYDFFLDKSKLEFLYQMKGWKFMVKSKWRVEYFAEDKSWAVVSFDKTMISRAGIQIISRTKDLNPVVLEHIHSKISDLGYLKGYISRLHSTNR